MTPKATVVIVKATGNVLGVVTHEGDPERGLSAAEVAGDAFPVRDEGTGDVLVDVPVAELDTTAVPVVDDLLKTPQQCVIVGGAATLGLSSASSSVKITFSAIKVAVDTAPRDLEVRVFVEHGQGSDRKRSVYTGKIAKGDTDLTIDATFDQDEYDLVAAVTANKLLTNSMAL
jgi:hypothetical protein